jgi:hypothetical protein
MARPARSAVAPGVPRNVEIELATGVVELRDDPDGSTTVWVNSVPSSVLRHDPAVLDFEYMRHMAAAIALWTAVRGDDRWLALHVGAAACTLPRHLAHAHPGSRHIAVDVDAPLATLAREWWDLPRAPRLRIREQDGLAALASRGPDSLDAVVRDAFAGDSTPSHLADDAWWSEAARAVRAAGLVVANVAARPGMSQRRDVDAARAAFGDVVAVGEHAVLRGRRRGNVVLIAGLPDITGLRRYAASAPLPTGVALDWRG